MKYLWCIKNNAFCLSVFYILQQLLLNSDYKPIICSLLIYP